MNIVLYNLVYLLQCNPQISQVKKKINIMPHKYIPSHLSLVCVAIILTVVLFTFWLYYMTDVLINRNKFAGVWKLPGVEEYGETSVIVDSSQSQLVDWNGLKLHIHAGSLPEGLHQCKIFIKVSLAGDYEIPQNSTPVSAFFWLRCEPQCNFEKPITVEIQHCSTKQDLSKLKIVRAFCSQKPLPYNFKPLAGGRFDANTSYGAIEVKSFSGVAVAEDGPASGRLYYSQLFYRNCLSYQHRSEHDIHIIYTWNTEAHINVSHSFYW